jgi:hypothetical protein
MDVSHVADDYAAIARRLKELQEEGQRAEERTEHPARPWLGYPTGRAPRLAEEPQRASRR